MRYLLIFTVLGWCMINYASGSSLPYYYMDELCNKTLDLTIIDAIRLKLSRNVFYKAKLNCPLRITSMVFTYRYMVFFRHFDVESSIGCDRDWLEIKDGPNYASNYVSAFKGRQCGSYISSKVGTTTGNDLFLQFISDESYQDTGFDMIITQYHTGPCYDREFSCSNGRCIHEDLVCNLENPCGDYSDCPAVLAAGAIAGIIIGSLMFCFIVACVFACICRRRRRKYRQPYGGVNVSSPAYGTQGYAYNAPVPQQYPAPTPPNYPANQQYPTQ